MTRKPAVTFAIVCVIALAGLTAYLFRTSNRLRDAREITPPAQPPITVVPDAGSTIAPAPAVTPPEAPAPPAVAPDSPNTAPPVATVASARLFFRHNGVEAHYGSLAWADTARLGDVHFVDSLRCEVVHVSGGHGICLSADRGVFTTYAATLFDEKSLAARKPFSLKGIPSRARVSVDGRLAAFTVFVSGHGYTTLDFSTQTLLVDYATGAVLADLEDFSVSQNGTPLKNPDFNFWGVTFTPDARNFYATLSTAGKHYLIHGDIAARSAEVIHENVECPSLSPDAKRVAYKKRLMDGNRVLWQLHVLDLATGRETPLSEKRSIDDQLEWLDNRNVLYSVPSNDDGSSPSTDVWRVAVDARTPPELFLRSAYSPSIARGSTR